MVGRRGTHAAGRSSWAGTLLVLLLLVLVGGGATVGVMASAGILENRKPAKNRDGLIPVPKSVRPLKAYAKVRREDIYDLRQGDDSYYWMPRERVEANPKWLLNPADIIGRVLAQDKEADYVFSEKDFLPKGSREGISGGIPAGKRSMIVNIEKVPGLELLRQGDAFDLVASLPVNGETAPSSVEYGLLLGGVKPPDTRAGQLARQSGVKVLVQGGVLVALTEKELPTSSRTSRQTPTKNATIAIEPEEITPLAEALGMEAKLFCIARSGQPEDTRETPEAFSLEGMVAVPATVRPLRAWSMITQDDLADPATGQLNLFYFPQDRLSAEWIVDVRDLLGRVIDRDLPAGHLFSGDDLMPRGTRPGPTAGAPPGMRVFIAPANRIQGLAALTTGDRIALYATLPNQVSAPPPELEWATLKGGVADPRTARLTDEVRSGIRLLVNEAVLVSLSEGAGEVTLAIAPDEITVLTQALHSDVRVFAVAASSHVVEPPRASRPGELPSAGVPVHGDAFAPAHLSLRMEELSFVVDDGEPLPWRTDLSSGIGDVSVVVDRPGWRACPVTARPVRAFQKLTIEDFIDPSTGRLRIFYFPPEKFSDDWVEEIELLLDRVVRSDIDGGRVIHNVDLLPIGSRPGGTAGIPPGRRSLTLTSQDVNGLESLQEGDRLDLVQARRFGMTEVGRASPALVTVRAIDPSFPQPHDIFSQAEVDVIARDVLVITRAAETRQELVTVERESAIREIVSEGGIIQREGVQKTQEPRIVERTVVVCTLAVSPEEVPRLTETLATGGKLFAAARSGDATPAVEDAAVPDASGLEPIRRTWEASAGRIHKIEQIRGTKRSSDLWMNGRPFGESPLGTPSLEGPAAGASVGAD